MKNSPTTRIFSEKLGEINVRYIEEAEHYQKNRRTLLWRIGTLAAAFVLVLSLVLVAITDYYGPIPTYDDAYFTAEEVGAMIPAFQYFGGTNAYSKIRVPSKDYLETNYLFPLPDEKTVPIYRYYSLSKPLPDRDEFGAYVDEMYARLEPMLGRELPYYEIEEYSDRVETRSGALDTLQLDVRQSSTSRSVIIRSGYGQGSDTVEIFGKPVQIDQTQTDEEILGLLTDVRNALFEAFGREFDSAKVERSNSDWSTVAVTYYDDVQSPPYKEGWGSDTIKISFRSYENGAGDEAAPAILDHCTIYYTEYLFSIEERFEVEANCRLITLQEAEKLLYAGYAFGFHTCPICMAEQPLVSFEGYDYVSFDYSRRIPFYVFYQYLGENEDGELIYAFTYVPAVEVSGLEEYFKNKEKEHETAFGW